MKKIIPISVLLILGILQTGYSTNYQFYGYTNDVYSVSTNWSSSGYPGATILSGDYARFTSNWSMGRCSLDVDVTNNGHMLFDSKFYYNGHLVTNNSFIEAVGIIYGDVTNNGASGIFSPGWNLLNFSKNASINGSFESSSTVRIDFYGSDYYGNTSHDAITTSTATISGTLDMHFITGFIPVIGQDYILINSTNLTGNFTNIIWPAGAAGTVTVNGSDDIVVNFSSALPVELEHFNVHIEDHIANLD